MQSLNIFNKTLIFYIVFIVLFLFGKIFIKFDSIQYVTYMVSGLYFTSLFTGIYLSRYLPVIIIKSKISLNIEYFVLLLTAIVTIATVYTWISIFNFYGSIEYLIVNSMTLREAAGFEIKYVPTVIIYINSLVFALFPISLALLKYNNTLKYKFHALYVLLLIILLDMQILGRVGILFSIFCLGGYVIISGKKFFNIKYIFISILLFMLLITPRLLRGSFDNFENTFIRIEPHMKYNVNPVLYPIISTYVYYFSGPYALNYFLNNDSSDVLTYGHRTITPIYNWFTYIFSDYKFSTVDDMAYIPFEHNVYSFIRDIYSDFNIIGVLFIPIIIGIYIGNTFKKHGIINNAKQIFIIGWIFYTPIYNLFSSGNFMIPYILLIFLGLMDLKLK